MLPPEIMKYFPVNCTNFYSIPAEYSLINDANYNRYFADYFPKIFTPENYLGWLTIEEHVRLPRLEPALVQCCLEAGIRINASDVLVFPATAVVMFAADCRRTGAYFWITIDAGQRKPKRFLSSR